MRAYSRMSCPALIAGAILIIWPGTAHAIPAFARKYQTSCQTCHIAFPKLNPFGEAFRLRGYRMPAETEDMIKEKPVPLGAPAYKRVWPDAVWPSDIPGTVPVSVGTIFSNVTQRTTTDGLPTTTNDFHFPEEVAVLSGGTLGDTLSFLGELTFAPTVDAGVSSIEVGIEQSELNFNGPWGTGPRFNVKVGRFRPESSRPFMENAVLTMDGPEAFFAFNPIASHGGAAVEEGPGISIPETVDGLEAYGILAHRFEYSGGLANGIGPGQTTMDGNSAKDFFGSVAYKIDGLALDGDGYQPSEKNWQERSLKVGAFAYHGDGGGILFSDAEGLELGQFLEDRRFTRLGVDANLFFDNANVITGYFRGRDELVTFDSDSTTIADQGEFTYHTWFAEGDYVFMPWLHGGLRYEWLRPEQAGAPDFKRMVPNVTALIRANVKAYMEWQRDLGASTDYLLMGGVRFAF